MSTWHKANGHTISGMGAPRQSAPLRGPPPQPARRVQMHRPGAGAGGPRTRPSGSSWARLPPTRVSERGGFNRGEMNKSGPPLRRQHPSRRGRGTPPPPHQREDNAWLEGAWRAWGPSAVPKVCLEGVWGLRDSERFWRFQRTYGGKVWGLEGISGGRAGVLRAPGAFLGRCLWEALRLRKPGRCRGNKGPQASQGREGIQQDARGGGWLGREPATETPPPKGTRGLALTQTAPGGRSGRP